MRLTRLSPLYALLFVALSACGGTSKLAVNFTPNSDMNDGNALQVVAFQLSNRAAFESTPHDSFWENDSAVLTNDLVSPKQKYILVPDVPQSLEIIPEESALFVGIAANYRSPDQTGWRVLFTVEELDGKLLELTAENNRLFAQIK